MATSIKESPRQRMINMMYLILTAMLALQISNAILEKFLLLDNSLDQANRAADMSNQRTLEAMNEAVENAGGREEYRKLYRDAEHIREKTSEIITYIHGLREIIIDHGGGGINPETGQIKNLAEESKIASYFVTNGKGYELKDKLNEYVDYIQQYAPNIKFEPLALDGEDDPAMANADPMTRGKDFAELMFSQTPVPAALAGLSQKESVIRRYESEVLDYLAVQVGAKEIKFDKLFAVVIPDSRTVVAGQTYRAEIAIGAYSTAITPSISINGSAIPVKEGKGVYEVRAGGGDFDQNGQLKRSYTASISYPKPDGTREVVNAEETFTVLRPSVQIATSSMPALYFRCANRLQTSSAGLGALYNPTYSGSGAEFIPGSGGKVTVVPNSNKVTLDINNDGILLQSFPFNVQRVPRPEIKILVNGSPLSQDAMRRGVSASSVRTITVVAEPDPSFKETNPEDAQYRVAGFSVVLASGSRSKRRLESSSNSINLSSAVGEAEAGDRYVITVENVQRRNFKGEVESVNIGDGVHTLALN